MQRFLLTAQVALILIFMTAANAPEAQAESGFTPQLRSYMHSMTSAEQPRIISGQVVFSYSSNHPVRYVAAAFGHEDFAQFHIYKKNQNGVFLFTMPLPEKVETLTYRIIVDGLWMKDPVNRLTVHDSRGIPISMVRLPAHLPEKGESPVIHSDGTVEFVHYGTPGKTVTVAGDFNHWSPFSHVLMETSPGVYRLRIRLYKGFHRYTYYVNGTAVTDSLNSLAAYDVFGNQVSGLVMPDTSEGS